ncbi:MAG: hypothetical protein OIF40_11545 [Mangrovicoccus sp.]|nr:hypothetical protein [Mangrovicoccus sp.]
MRGMLAMATVAMLALAACDNPARQDAVFSAKNGFVVHPIGEGRFEVIARGSSAANGYFCAAGDYARRRLGAMPADRVIVVDPVGPAVNNPGGKSAKFTVVPSGTGSSSISPNVNRVGQSMSIAHARTLCDRSMPGFFGSSR